MFTSLAIKIFGSSNERQLKSISREIEPINGLEEKYEPLSNEELRQQTNVLKERIQNGETLDDILHDAFAVVREAAKRTLGQRHYDVQLIGGIVLHRGLIAEMKTGEGKTLVSTLAVYLNALEGKGVHIVTVNDYLAQRDSEWMGQIYRFLGLEVGCIMSGMDESERKAAYKADITYGTNNEFGFDYLRDNMKYGLDQMVQRPFNFAVIDEVDSILIDEARTPLIISGPSEDSSALYKAMNKIIPRLKPEDYEVDEKMRSVIITDAGTEHAENLLKEDGILEEGELYDANNIALVHHLNKALQAYKLYKKDDQYIVKDGKVVLIDEFTGRMMEGRRLSEGLHQAIEAKEGVNIQNENQTLASITFQNYFRLYPKLSGMTGTAMTEATEFMDIYKLGAVEIPTNLPIARLDQEDEIYKSITEKEQAIVKQIKICQDKKQPVLVGTVSIERSELLSAQLKKAKIKHEVLNARHHEREAFIVAQAGRPAAVTIATNMAGRGTDIQLGGNADMRIAEEVDPDWPESKRAKAIEKIKAEVAQDKNIVKEAGGLYVLGTERHESRRIDNQLRGRSGRQGDPGESKFFLSLDDDLMRVFGAEKMEALLAHKKIGLREGEALIHPWISKALERAQARVEAQNYEIRKNLLKFDDVMNDQRKIIYEQRREIMEGNDVKEMVDDMRHELLEDIVHQFMPPKSYAEQWDTDSLAHEVQRIFNIDAPISDWAKEEGIADQEILERLIDASDKRMASMATEVGQEGFRRHEKNVVLFLLDQQWKDHLLALDHLRQGINLRAFGQRDPLNEYKAEAFAFFENMLDRFREQVVQTLSMIEIKKAPSEDVLKRQSVPMHETRTDPALSGSAQKQMQSQTQGQPMGDVKPFPQKVAFDKNNPETWGKVPRNAPCPCGSGKKYKHCHGKLAS